MTTNLSRLAKSLDEAAPDLKIAELMRQERDKIEESLKTVGEYVLSDDNGRVYIITSAEQTADEASEASENEQE